MSRRWVRRVPQVPGRPRHPIVGRVDARQRDRGGIEGVVLAAPAREALVEAADAVEQPAGDDLTARYVFVGVGRALDELRPAFQRPPTPASSFAVPACVSSARSLKGRTRRVSANARPAASPIATSSTMVSASRMTATSQSPRAARLIARERLKSPSRCSPSTTCQSGRTRSQWARQWFQTSSPSRRRAGAGRSGGQTRNDPPVVWADRRAVSE